MGTLSMQWFYWVLRVGYVCRLCWACNPPPITWICWAAITAVVDNCSATSGNSFSDDYRTWVIQERVKDVSRQCRVLIIIIKHISLNNMEIYFRSSLMLAWKVEWLHRKINAL